MKKEDLLQIAGILSSYYCCHHCVKETKRLRDLIIKEYEKKTIHKQRN